MTVASAVAPVRLSDSLTAEYLEEHMLLPLECAAGRVVVAHAGRPDPQALSELAELFGARVELLEMPADVIMAAVRIAYAPAEGTAAELIAGLEDSPAGEGFGAGDDGAVAHELEGLANQPPVIRLVNLLLSEALQARASDVHLEHVAPTGGGAPGTPFSSSRTTLNARFRLDGDRTGQGTGKLAARNRLAGAPPRRQGSLGAREKGRCLLQSAFDDMRRGYRSVEAAEACDLSLPDRDDLWNATPRRCLRADKGDDRGL